IVAMILLIFGGKYPRPALVAAGSAFILTFLGHALTSQDPNAVSILIFNISQDSLLKGLRLGIRLTSMIIPAIAFIAATPIHELLEAFVGLRIPDAAKMYLTIVLRYVDILWYDIQISMKAMALRGVNWDGSIKDKVPAFSRLMLPLIFRILDHIDGQSLAIDNRGGVKASKDIPEYSESVNAIAMKNVFVRYDEADKPDDGHALSDINLEIPQGDATVLLGRIGTGKTSTLLLCTGLIPKSVGRMKGDVEIFGHNTKSASLGLLGRLSRIVFPSAVQGLIGLTVEGELEFSLRSSELASEEKQQAMETALELVGLDSSFLPRLTLGLSGGEMQRLALASAIVSQPLLLTLDDVTVQLDPVGKREVVSALQGLLDGQITTIITDPYVELLTEVGHRFISLEEGRIVGDYPALDAATIEEASLRVPQMMRLGKSLDIQIPMKVNDAFQTLQPHLKGSTPEYSHTATKPAPAIVSAENLVYTYPNGPTAIKGLDITFNQGEFVAILGSNGSGKTTLALNLAGALSADSGTILIQGEPYDQSRHQGLIGYVFQEPVNQIVTMKVSDELAFGPERLGWDEDAIQESVTYELERFGLSPDATPLHLTPAEARKLAIGSTLSMKPKMVILDEPTNNLDEDESQSLMAHLKSLQKNDTTVVLITHDVEIACEYADRMIVMTKGEIIFDGPTRKAMAEKEMLAQCDVMVPTVVDLSLALWPDKLPALSVEELSRVLIQ
ncbi:MAG: ATP-binding cassette domain-containing protein, partial [Chloroflexi bacterium]|nr:ATP-binding cassette domain-containing protein [Chloroflexota bacterium]